MAKIMMFVFLLIIKTAISKPIYGNLYEEQALHERIEKLAAIHEVQVHVEVVSTSGFF